ncbi:hypothetical protein, partial [Anaerococcus octavius]|uniref:hypothetical protein n=1 Tax=Anaerococcus octavius TaxID=54007 RepID=UPI0027BA0961
MKNKKSNKKTMALMSLAMVISLPITSHAAEETKEEVPQNYEDSAVKEDSLNESTDSLSDKDDKELEGKKETTDNAKSDVTEETENSTSLSEEAKAVEEKATETTIEEEQTQDSPKDAVEEKEAFTLSEAQRQDLKDAGYTDSEIAEIEEEIANKLEANSSFDAQTLVDEKISEKTATLEMDEE